MSARPDEQAAIEAFLASRGATKVATGKRSPVAAPSHYVLWDDLCQTSRGTAKTLRSLAIALEREPSQCEPMAALPRGGMRNLSSAPSGRRSLG